MDFSIDFSPIGNLGKVYDEGRLKAVRESSLAELANTDDPTAYDRVGRKLIAAGDLQGGMSLAALGQKLGQRRSALELAKSFSGLFGQDQSTATSPAPTTAPMAAPIAPIPQRAAPPPDAPRIIERTPTGEPVYDANGPSPMESDVPPVFAPKLDDRSRDLAIRTIFGEARNQSPEGQTAVASVIRNRMQAGRYGGDNVSGVVLAKNQFEPWANPEARAGMLALSKDDPRYQAIGNIVDQVFGGQAADPTNGATHFFAPKAQAALGRAAPSWAQGQGQVIGDHTFYAPEGRVQIAQAGGGMPAGALPAPASAPAPAAAPGQPAPAPGATPRLPQATFAGRPMEQWVKVMSAVAVHPDAPAEVQKFATEFVKEAVKEGGLTGDQKDYRSYGLQEIAAGRVPVSFREWDLERRRASATAITNDMRGENEEAKATGKAAGERAAETMKAAGAATKSLANLARVGVLLDQVQQGKVEPARQTVSAWAKSLGLDDATAERIGLDPKGVGSAQALAALTNELVIGKIGSGGFPANNFSDADRSFLVSTVPNLGNDPRANKILVEVARRVAQTDLEKGREWMKFRRDPANKGKSFDDFDFEWASKAAARDMFGDLAREAQSIIGPRPAQTQQPQQQPQTIVPPQVRALPLQQQMDAAPVGSIIKEDGKRTIKQPDGTWVPYNG